MKTLKYITIVLVGLLLFSCEVDYESDPNKPEVAPTYGIMNRVQKRFMDDTRDEWFSGRQSILWVQYWNQVNYTEEDRFQFRETVNQSDWDDIYKNAQDLVDLIALNTDEATKGDMAQYGANVNQISAARIMLVYIYLHATELWGDVPYWSYGDNANTLFEANKLKTDGIDMPVYAPQRDIYIDMIKELGEAQAAILLDENMIDGDNFFDGDATQWKKFANSLRLRIANRVVGVYPAAATAITQAIAAGVMTSNSDNAGVTYEANAVNGAPMYRAFIVSARNDFAPSYSFVDLLQGKRGPFGADPRLDIYVADNANGDKVGIPLTNANSVVVAFKDESMPGDAVLAADYTELYMEYSEVCFILSEQNGWDQDWYVKGIRASMEKWGVAEEDIATYLETVPPASEQNVMMQKYIALYMQPMEAWSEYRRTGYPNTLIKPTASTNKYSYTYPTASGMVTEEFYFDPIGGLTDLPTRNTYLLNEASINGVNVAAAAIAIGGDEQDTPLWWMN